MIESQRPPQAPAYGVQQQGLAYPPVVRERIIEEERIIRRSDQGRGGQGVADRASELAAAPPAPKPERRPQPVELSDWSYADDLRNQWRAEQLIGAEARNRNDQVIGNVENILIDSDDRITGLLVRVDEMRGVDDTVVNVPWDKVRLAADGTAVQVPVSANNARTYALYGESGVLQAALGWAGQAGAEPQRTWKVTDLIDDYATLADGSGYGYVGDVAFDRTGRVAAVIVHRDLAQGGGGGTFAYPFHGAEHGFEPWLPYYALPYGAAQVAGAEPLDEPLD